MKHSIDFDSLSDEELAKMVEDNKTKLAMMKEEAEQKIEILNEKIAISRQETDESLKEAITKLDASILDLKAEIAKLKEQNSSVSQSTTEMNHETLDMMTEIIGKLGVQSVSDIVPEIQKLKALEKEEQMLQEELSAKESGESKDSKASMQKKIRKLLEIWSENSLNLAQDSPLNTMFIALRDWLNSMTEDSFSSKAGNTVLNDLLNEFEVLAD